MTIPTGATAYDYVQTLYGRPTRLIERLATVTTAQSEVLRNNPRRLFWQVVNVVGSAAWVYWTSGLPPLYALQLAQVGGSIAMTVNEDGEAVTYTLYGITLSGDATFHILEVEAR